METPLIEKLETYYIRFKEIGQLITDPEVIGDMERYVKLTKEYKDLEAITAAADEYKKALDTIEESRMIWIQRKMRSSKRWHSSNWMT